MATKNQETEPGTVDKFLLSLFQIKAPLGAITPLYLATDPEIEQKNYRGLYFVPYCTLADASPVACNIVHAEKTWDWTKSVLQKHFRPDWSFE